MPGRSTVSALLGGTWARSILWHLKNHPVRFIDFARRLGGARKQDLNDRLKQMNGSKLAKRKVICASHQWSLERAHEIQKSFFEYHFLKHKDTASLENTTTMWRERSMLQVIPEQSVRYLP